MIKCKKECEMNENGACYCPDNHLIFLNPNVSGIICWFSGTTKKGTAPIKSWHCGNNQCTHWFQLKTYKKEGYTIGHCDVYEMDYVDKCPEYSVKGS